MTTRSLALILFAAAALTCGPPQHAFAAPAPAATKPAPAASKPAAAKPAAAALAVDSSYRSPKNRGRPTRRRTELIILHTTEGGVIGALEKLSKNGECHYVVDTTGKIYSIIDKTRVAYHAGLSMWNGKTDVDKFSIGIEIVGYHDKEITARQYDALRQLLRELKATYRIADDKVLTHSMVAYGNPNRWQKSKHRGRKRCGMLLATNAARQKLGLYAKPAFDPDLRAKRLVDADPELTRMLYAGAATITRPAAPSPTPPRRPTTTTTTTTIPPATPRPAPTLPPTPTPAPTPQPQSVEIPAENADESTSAAAQKNTATASPAAAPAGASSAASAPAQRAANIIGPKRSAWDIARDLYAAKTTIYIFPDGSEKSGDKIKDWKKELQPGTIVNVGQVETGGENENSAEGLVTIGADGTAHELAGGDASSDSTYYFKPGDKQNYKAGSTMNDVEIDALPDGTRMLVGYKRGGPVSAKLPVFNICGVRWNNHDTYYLDPSGKITPGDKIDEKNIKPGSMVFYKE